MSDTTRILRIMSDVFDIPVHEFGEIIKINNPRAWSSLKHIDLSLALEEEFGVRLSVSDATKMTSMESIAQTLDNYSVRVIDDG